MTQNGLWRPIPETAKSEERGAKDGADEELVGPEIYEELEGVLPGSRSREHLAAQARASTHWRCRDR